MSVRTKFTLGIIFFFIIILVLFFFSSIQLSRLSKKTDAILKENHLSVVYAREMMDALSQIDYELTCSYLRKSIAERKRIDKQINQFKESLSVEKRNITEAGENKLVALIESNFTLFSDTLKAYLGRNIPSDQSILSLQGKSMELNNNLMLLSQMNEKAIEVKTNDAKEAVRKARTQMAALGALCFLIAFSFTYNFASYFNQRFSQLYNGIKEIILSNYGQRLHFEGKDEFVDMAIVFNEMAENLSHIDTDKKVGLVFTETKEESENELQELENALTKVHALENEILELLSRHKFNMNS